MEKDPSAPKGILPTEPIKLFDRIVTLSQSILDTEASDNMGHLLELIQERGKLLEMANKLPLKSFSKELVRQVDERMQTINSLEPKIHQKMNQIKDQMGQQLNKLQDSKTSLSGYRLEVDDNDSTMTSQA